MKISRRDLKRLVESYVNENNMGFNFGGNTKAADPWEFSDISVGGFNSPAEKAADTFLSNIQDAVGALGIEDDVQIEHTIGDISAMFVPSANLAIIVGPAGAPEAEKSKFSKKSAAEMHKLEGAAGEIYNRVLKAAKARTGTAFDASNKAKGTITGRGHTALFVIR